MASVSRHLEPQMVRVLKQVVPHVRESSEGTTVEGARLREAAMQLRRVKASQREGHLAQRALISTCSVSAPERKQTPNTSCC